MKRSRAQYKSSLKRKSAKRRLAGPARTYSGSRVPVASRGYKPNPYEKKVFDINSANYDVNTTGSITLLNVPTLGTDMTNRIGRKIILRSVYIRGILRTSGSFNMTTISQQSQLARMLLVWDTQPNGSSPAITDILKAASATSQLNIDSRDRFKVLCDKQFAMGPFVIDTVNHYGLTSNQQAYAVKKYKKLYLETIFNSTNGGSIADITTGALWMVWVGSQPAGNDDCIATVTSRLRFSDA